MAHKPTPPHILMTRPRAASERFLDALAELRLPIGRIVVSPAISIERLGGQIDASGCAGVILTSPHAVWALAGARGATAWCVGDATAAAAGEAGLDARSAGGDAGDLLRLLSEARPSGPLLYLRGRHTAADIAGALAALGLEVEERIVYDQPECGPSPEARALLEGIEPVVLPLFSPRSAQIVAGWATGSRAPLDAVAMSRAVAEAWGGPGRVALRPTLKSMVEATATALGGTGNG